LPGRPAAADYFARRLKKFAGRPKIRMDAFSQILSAVKLTGAIFFNAEFSAPWGFTMPASTLMAARLAPDASYMVFYHLLIEGRSVVEMLDGQSVGLEPGDIVVFPQGDAHHMSSGKDAVLPFPNYGITAKVKARDLRALHAGGGGEISRFVCGYMSCDRHLCKPILNGLPTVLKVNIRTDRAGHWLENSILHLVEEAASGRAGSDAMLAKLTEALFIDTLRRYLSGLSGQQTGWLAGTRDSVVGKSLALLHGRVAHPWTIASLADEVGTSRSTLVERFTTYLGEPPIAYLTRWRLELAARSLEKTSRGVAEIASDVGYESEAAFNRAFKRQYGQPPGRYRNDHKCAV
jgi:AraC-like DNA-binding protein